MYIYLKTKIYIARTSDVLGSWRGRQMSNVWWAQAQWRMEVKIGEGGITNQTWNILVAN
jgi:hypothetical protein